MVKSNRIGPEAIRKARDALNESQTQFATRLGVNQTTISRWENAIIPIAGPGRILLERLLQDIERVHGDA